jgi:hypothetical protein
MHIDLSRDEDVINLTADDSGWGHGLFSATAVRWRQIQPAGAIREQEPTPVDLSREDDGQSTREFGRQMPTQR